MAFFKQFPDVSLDIYGDGDKYKVVDLFRSADVPRNKINDFTTYFDYVINDGERPDVVSQKLYNDPNFHWTFFVINDDLKEGMIRWPLSDFQLDKHINQIFGEFGVLRLQPYVSQSGDDVDFINRLTGIDLEYPNLRVKDDNGHLYPIAAYESDLQEIGLMKGVVTKISLTNLAGLLDAEKTFGRPPPIVISGGGGYGAKGEVILDENGVATGARIVNEGRGFKRAPKAVIDVEPTTAAVISCVSSEFGLTYTLVNGGSGHYRLPQISIVDRDGLERTLDTSNIASSIASDGGLTSINVDFKENNNYRHKLSGFSGTLKANPQEIDAFRVSTDTSTLNGEFRVRYSGVLVQVPIVPLKSNGKIYSTLWENGANYEQRVIQWSNPPPDVNSAEPFVWVISDSGGTKYYSEEDVEYPWEVTNWYSAKDDTIKTVGFSEFEHGWTEDIEVSDILNGSNYTLSAPEVMIVQNFATSTFNDLYTIVGEINNYPIYQYRHPTFGYAVSSLEVLNNRWVLRDTFGSVVAESSGLTDTPDLATWSTLDVYRGSYVALDHLDISSTTVDEESIYSLHHQFTNDPITVSKDTEILVYIERQSDSTLNASGSENTIDYTNCEWRLIFRIIRRLYNPFGQIYFAPSNVDYELFTASVSNFSEPSSGFPFSNATVFKNWGIPSSIVWVSTPNAAFEDVVVGDILLAFPENTSIILRQKYESSVSSSTEIIESDNLKTNSKIETMNEFTFDLVNPHFTNEEGHEASENENDDWIEAYAQWIADTRPTEYIQILDASPPPTDEELLDLIRFGIGEDTFQSWQWQNAANAHFDESKQTYAEYLYRLNDSKKSIKVVRPEQLQKFVRAYRKKIED